MKYMPCDIPYSCAHLMPIMGFWMCMSSVDEMTLIIRGWTFKDFIEKLANENN
jgi:hypothetical protein